MIRQAAAGLAALGLVGGAGSVVMHDHGATVKVGKESTNIRFASNARYSCPAGTADELEAELVTIGRIKITLRQRPNDGRLIEAYNREVDAYNTQLKNECSL